MSKEDKIYYEVLETTNNREYAYYIANNYND